MEQAAVFGEIALHYHRRGQFVCASYDGIISIKHDTVDWALVCEQFYGVSSLC